MPISDKIWKEAERLILARQFQNAVDLLEPYITKCASTAEWARLSHQLAVLYSHIRGKGLTAANFAVVAGRCYLSEGRTAQAASLLLFLLEIPEARIQRKTLEAWVAKAVSARPKKDTKEKKTSLLPELKTAFNEEGIERIKNETLRKDQFSSPHAQTTPLFSRLPKKEVQKLLYRSSVEELREGQVLFKEGDEALAFYVIAEGKMALESSSGQKIIFQEGDFFGELALFANIKRTATLKAASAARLLVFTKEQLKKAFVESPALGKKIQAFYSLRLFLTVAKRSPYFQTLNESELEEVFTYFKPKKVGAGAILIEQGAPSEELFLVLHGHCEAYKNGKSIRRIGPGDFFGEIGLIRNIPRTAQVKAIQESGLLICQKNDFEELKNCFPKLKKALKEIADLREPEVPSIKGYPVLD